MKSISRSIITLSLIGWARSQSDHQVASFTSASPGFENKGREVCALTTDQGPVLLIWINFNPTMDKLLHPL